MHLSYLCKMYYSKNLENIFLCFVYFAFFLCVLVLVHLIGFVVHEIFLYSSL